ncbi:spore germination protein [Paenibacillus koleovorans]|uniref:spore germination protein n=1 Tax=Paenibacillus koleovorans TaxID=121608 RepID=UPI000FDCC58A|nr:spore germination protein [Paenibacillus koleovorans]
MEQLFSRAGMSSDFLQTSIGLGPRRINLAYFKTMIDLPTLHALNLIMQERAEEPGAAKRPLTLDEVRAWLPIDTIQPTRDPQEMQDWLMRNSLLIWLEAEPASALLVEIPQTGAVRQENATENEFSVVGPKIGFVERLDSNIQLLRYQISLPNLVFKEIKIGSVSKTRVAIVYLDGVTNPTHIQTVETRLQKMDFEVVFDSSQLDQIIADNSWTPFPLFVSTERRDRVVYSLISGQVAIMSEGSPYVITGPSTLYDFFISPEDYYLPWVLGSFFRLVRIVGVLFSIFATSIYVAVATYHYQILPVDLLTPFIQSRQYVPLPPVLEVLFLEITIEFLREAGARLPTKIGQTLGIVGGVIIGQAAVEAAFTSNILIIVVALSALASFTTPIYKMSNTIRFLRFPLIILAAFWGGIGVVVGLSLILIHITRLRSLNNPYTVPIFPFYRRGLSDSVIRSSYNLTTERPAYLNPLSRTRYKPRSEKKTPEEDE